MDSKIILDQKAFKALAADTRVSIIKHLKSRRYTQSELAKLLDLKVPSIKEHILALERAELVKKIDEGRKWKYYELTSKAKAILDPEKKQILITLVVFLLSAAGSIYLFFKGILSKTVIYQLTSKEVGQEVARISVVESVVEKAAPLMNETSGLLMDKFIEEAPKMEQKFISKAVPYFAEKTTTVFEPNNFIYFFAILMLVSLLLLVFFMIKRQRTLRLLP